MSKIYNFILDFLKSIIGNRSKLEAIRKDISLHNVYISNLIKYTIGDESTKVIIGNALLGFETRISEIESNMEAIVFKINQLEEIIEKQINKDTNITTTELIKNNSKN
jgi:uncharacterized protein YdbL (DUF1318 family)